MAIGDLVLILAVLGSLCTLGVLFVFLVRRQWRQARDTAVLLLSSVALYGAILVSVALVSPQRVLSMHQNHCFDDWCLSVERVIQQPTVGVVSTMVQAHGLFYLVTVRVSSQAKAISQRALDVQIYLLDATNQRYNSSRAGQQALDATGNGGLPLSSTLSPGASFLRTIVFDVPPRASHLALVVTHGLFPDLLVIGSEQSVLHQPTLILLQPVEYTRRSRDE